MYFDLGVYLGRWPFRRLRYAGAGGVRQLMSRTKVGQALAVPLAAEKLVLAETSSVGEVLRYQMALIFMCKSKIFLWPMHLLK